MNYSGTEFANKLCSFQSPGGSPGQLPSSQMAVPRKPAPYFFFFFLAAFLAAFLAGFFAAFLAAFFAMIRSP